MTRIYLNGPAIARLRIWSRMSANEHMRAGHFGELIQRGRVKYAARDQVEVHAGRAFTEAEIMLAAAGKPSRILEVTDG